MIRIPIPALTEERRKELSRHVHKLAEEGRNTSAQVRRDANDRLKKLLKDHQISEDDEKQGARRSAEDHRPAHQARSTSCRRRRTRSCLGSNGVVVSRHDSLTDVVLHPSRMLRAVRAPAARSARAPPSSARPAALPLLARYDLDAARALDARHRSPAATPNMWRYRELMPLLRRRRAGHARRGLHAAAPRQAARRDARPRAPVHQGRVAQPDQLVQGARPVGGDHAREGARRRRPIALPTAGNAGNAAAAYAAAAGSTCEVFIPKDAKQPFVDECRLYGADVTLVDGLITDAGRIAAETGKPLGWYDVSTLKEPYRIEGKKTMGYELAEQLGLDAARLDHLSDRRRHRAGRHVEGVRRDGSDRLDRRRRSGRGWCRCRPRAARRSSARSSRAPRRRAPWENAHTVADGLRVPRAIGDFLILRAVRESGGTALAVSDAEMVDGHAGDRPLEGVSAAPEGGAALAAIRRLVADGTIKPRRDGGAVQHRRRAEVSRRAAASVKSRLD